MTTYAYNSDDLISSVTDTLSRSTQLQYDHAGRLDGVVNARSQTTTYEPLQSKALVDLNGTLGTQANPASLTVLSTPMASIVTDALGNDNIYAFRSSGGWPSKILDLHIKGCISRGAGPCTKPNVLSSATCAILTVTP